MPEDINDSKVSMGEEKFTRSIRSKTLKFKKTTGLAIKANVGLDLLRGKKKSTPKLRK